MIQRIRNYVNELFANAPKTKQAYDLKEEVCSNLIDKYVDLTGQGMPEEEAYNAAVASIGDIDELFRTLQKEVEEDPQARRRSALLIAISVAIYIISIVPLFLSQLCGYDPIIGLILMFVLCAAATALIVYNALSKPKYQKLDDTLVEEFKEWKQQKQEGESIFGILSGALWLTIVALYFILSFALGIWAFSWIIFIIGAAVQQIVRAVFLLNGKK